MTPEEIRIRLHLKPFDEHAWDCHERRLEECRRTTGFTQIWEEREDLRFRLYQKAYRPCRKCSGDRRVKRHARFCHRRGSCHIGASARKRAVALYDREPNPLRGTGRTTKSLLEVMSLLSEGKNVVFVTHSELWRQECRNRLAEYIRRIPSIDGKGMLDYHVRDHGWQMFRRKMPGEIEIVDHYAAGIF
jgi:hypothetical protein